MLLRRPSHTRACTTRRNQSVSAHGTRENQYLIWFPGSKKKRCFSNYRKLINSAAKQTHDTRMESKKGVSIIWSDLQSGRRTLHMLVSNSVVQFKYKGFFYTLTTPIKVKIRSRYYQSYGCIKVIKVIFFLIKKCGRQVSRNTVRIVIGGMERKYKNQKI